MAKDYPQKTFGVPTGTFRAYYLALVVFICGFKTGYDSGVVGAVLTFKSFERDYHYKNTTKVNSFSVGFQQLGSMVACMFVPILSAKFGRKPAVLVSAATFILGAVLETIPTHALPAWYVGRIVAGMGLGGCSVIVPMYSGEMAPKEIRGRMGSCYQWLFTWGIFTSYWIDYGVSRGLSPTNSAMWQIPIGLQMLAPTLLFIGMATLPESTRWLVQKGRDDEAFQSLSWVRASDGPEVHAEFAEIKDAVDEDRRMKEGLTWREMLSPANRARLGTGIMLYLFQQMTSANALANFGPQFFKLLVGPGQKDILLTALFGAVKVAACTIFIVFMSERFGRRPLLVFGALFMGVSLLACGLVFKYHPPPATGVVTPAGKATVALIYIAIIGYNFSWGPIPWAIVPELFPTRTRDLGMSICLVSHWLWSFVFVFSTPYMLRSWGWGIFLFYSISCFIMAFVVFFTLRETRGKSLERIQKEIDLTGGHARREFDSQEDGFKVGSIGSETDLDSKDKVDG